VLVTDGISVKIRAKPYTERTTTRTPAANVLPIASLSRKCAYTYVTSPRDTGRCSRRCIAAAQYCKTSPARLPNRSPFLHPDEHSDARISYERPRMHFPFPLPPFSPSFHPLRSSNPSVSDALLSTLACSRIPLHSARWLNTRLIIGAAEIIDYRSAKKRTKKSKARARKLHFENTRSVARYRAISGCVTHLFSTLTYFFSLVVDR